MTYYIPEEVIAKANKAYKDAPLPGQDAMAAALREIKDELWKIIIEEYEFEKALSDALIGVINKVKEDII